MAWWSEPGRPGYTPDADGGTTFPRTLAGHVRGGWALVLPGHAPAELPYPGVPAARWPLPWFDSLAVAGPDGAWQGFDAALARLEALDRLPEPGPRGGARASADFVLANGSSAYDETGLALRRADSLSWARIDLESWNRGGLGALADAGRHLYGGAAGWRRGAHALDASFGQRSSAARLGGGAEQAVSGAGGHLRWNWRAGDRRFEVALRRGYDHHESFGDTLVRSRRDAQENDAEAIAAREGARTSWRARLAWRRAQVFRTLGDSVISDRKADVLWGVVGLERALGEGRIEAALGGGHHGGVDRTALAPALAYRFSGETFAGRIALERLLAPVWSDLAPGHSAFLQRTWAMALEVDGRWSKAAARISFLAGRTHSRALVTRQPIEELWLRAGFRPETGGYDFGLLTASAAADARHWGAGAEGFALARDPGDQPRVDPGTGGRAFVEGRVRLFTGDLGVRLRGEAEAVGARESDGPAPRRLDGYVTGAASAIVTLGDAVFSLRLRNLEDRRRAQVWMDRATGREALGPGREMLFTFTWRLFN